MKKIIYIVLFVFIDILKTFALPGFTPIIDTSSGDYAWYRDETFSRQSFIGFLCYDNDTYQMRYFAPGNKKKHLPQLNVAIYVTLDKSKDYADFSGERIISARTSQDAAIINYLHDIFYEFCKRRAAVLKLSNKPLKISDDFEQFGGPVDLMFDSLVPIFNLRYIENNKGEKKFSLITAGKLLSSDDSAFDNFCGLEISEQEKHKFLAPKGVDPVDFQTGNQSITVDSTWTPIAENSFACGNVANITCAQGSGVAGIALIRRLLQSTGTALKDWESLTIDGDDKNGFVIKTYVHDKDATGVMYNIMNLKQSGDNSFYYFSISVYKDVYEKNKKYFDTIINSYYIADFSF